MTVRENAVMNSTVRERQCRKRQCTERQHKELIYACSSARYTIWRKHPEFHPRVLDDTNKHHQKAAYARCCVPCTHTVPLRLLPLLSHTLLSPLLLSHTTAVSSTHTAAALHPLLISEYTTAAALHPLLISTHTTAAALYTHY